MQMTHFNSDECTHQFHLTKGENPEKIFDLQTIV